MKKDLVSVIIPVYNAADRIENCINSVLKQTYPNIELIVVNDGSTDETGKILLSLKETDSRILLINQENKGVSCARNVGIDHSSGQLIMFLDADDYLEIDCIEKMVLLFEDKVELVVCGFQLRNKEGILCDQNDKIEKYEDDREICEFMLLDQWKERISLIGPCGKLFKASIINTHNIRFLEGLQIGEDTLFVLNYYEHIRSVVCLYEQLYVYWRTEGSLSSYGRSVTEIVQARLLIIEKKLNIFQYKGMLDDFAQIHNEALAVIKMFIINGIYDLEGRYKKYIDCFETMRNNKLFRESLAKSTTESVTDFVLKQIFLKEYKNVTAIVLCVLNKVFRDRKG